MVENKYYTFNPKGLTDIQIKFLAECERLWFEGMPVNVEMIKEAVKNVPEAYGPETGAVEAWDYWTFLKKSVIRESEKCNVMLEDYFEISFVEKPGYFYCRRPNDDSIYLKPKEKFLDLPIELIYELTPRDFHFFFNEYGYLFLEYNLIIGSRCIGLFNSKFISIQQK